MLYVGAEGVSEARGQFVGALALLAEQVERPAESATAGQFVDAAAEDEDAIAQLVGEGGAQVGDVLVEFAAGLDDKFRSGRRR